MMTDNGTPNSHSNTERMLLSSLAPAFADRDSLRPLTSSR